jgi:AAA15 family ATPase/GTPase
MLTYLELKNFKSFSDITFDLRKAYGEPKKIAFIYGENGSGKSNLMSSLLFLLQTIDTLKNQTKIVDLIDNYKMLDNEQAMSLKFGFRINGFDGSYHMVFSEHKITAEELRYQINEREGVVFSLDKNQTTLSPTIFYDAPYKKELQDTIDKYWGKHSFMAILFNEHETKNDDYIEARLHKNIFDVFVWLNRLCVWSKENDGGYSLRISTHFEFLLHLGKGIVKDKNNRELERCETAVNTFFTQLYSDIKSAYYVFTPEKNQYSYELYFKKFIGGKLVDVPISLESTGTQKLLEIFPVLFAGIAGASVFVDEIDSGIHDLLMKNLLERLNDSLEGQFIATTHNTLLMESLPTENTYIIRVDANGNKFIECIADYKQRTQRTNNIRSKYLRGDYEGIPYAGYFDFEELVTDVLGNIQPFSPETGGIQE